MCNLPEKIISTIQLCLSAKALICQRLQAFTASHAMRVPTAFKDVEEELVKNGLIAARTGVSHPDRWFCSTWKIFRQINTFAKKITFSRKFVCMRSILNLSFFFIISYIFKCVSRKNHYRIVV